VGKQAPPVLLLVAVGLPTVLAAVIFMGVRATSSRTWRTPARLAPIGVVLFGIAGVLYYQDGLIPFPPGDSPLVVLFFFPLALSIPVALGTAAAIHGRMTVSPRLWWGLLLLPVLLVAGYVFTFGAIVASFAIATFALFPMEYGQTYDGLPYVPGAVTIGLLLGFLAAIVLDGARPGPAPLPSDANAQSSVA
jgi:hypothetical protein